MSQKKWPLLLIPLLFLVIGLFVTGCARPMKNTVTPEVTALREKSSAAHQSGGLYI
ncbi:conserved hypothetical protein [Heliomicrobium modesticaldum Ice1]|uniref:Lipoprotein n=1 Tax=Heliobacterium modesticaldum (strain ATCC 51547 / Ice1) TaxID=498761 RepID=B0TBC5_HELMI|nr:conserved hypothetical protein [Heliomicrobium modesticaldum Ice1]